MIKRLFTNQTRSITGAAIILGAASLLSRVIGIVRDRIFAHQFGAGIELDIYYAAFKIPDLVYNLLIVGALSAGFIPVFMKLLVKDKAAAWRVTNSVINILGAGLIVICGFFFIITPQLMRFIVPGFDEGALEMTVLLTRIMFLSPILLGMSGIVSGVLQSMNSFLVYALTPIMYNLGIILGAVGLVPYFGLVGLAYGVAIGAFLHLIIQLPTFFHHGFRYQALFLWKDPHVREIGKLMVPRTLGLAANQINLIVITVLASTLAAGSISVFTFASNIQYFPIGIIGYSFAIAAFPALARFVAEDKIEDVIDHVASTVRKILFLIIPMTILLLLLRAQIVRVLLGTGEFDWTATILTADALAWFSLSLFAQCLIPLLARTFYALHDTWTPFVVGIIAAVTNIGLSLYLKDLYGVIGLAAAFSASMIVQLILLWLLLHHRLGTLRERAMLQLLLKVSFAAYFMAVVTQVLKTPVASFVDMTRFWGILSQGAISGTIGLLIYGALCYVLQLEEMAEFSESCKRRWLKLRGFQGEIEERA